MIAPLFKFYREDFLSNMTDTITNLLAQSTIGPFNQVEDQPADPSQVNGLPHDLTANQNFAFSLQGAVASLEQSAAQSLNIHGAAPQNNGLTQPQSDQNRTGARATTNQANTKPLSASQNTLTQNPAQSQPNTTAPITNQAQAPQNLSSTNIQSPHINSPFTPSLTQVLPASANALTGSPLLARQSAIQSTPAASALPAVQNVGPANRNLNAPLSRSPRTIATTQTAPTSPDETSESFTRFVASRLRSATFQGGQTQFDVRLDPPELGRVDIRLIAGDKSIDSLILSFENQSTLDYFRQDRESLNTTLQEAGFDTDKNNISFELTKNDNSFDSHKDGHPYTENTAQDQPTDGHNSSDGFNILTNLNEHSQTLPLNIGSSQTIFIDKEGARNVFRDFSSLPPHPQKLINIHL